MTNFGERLRTARENSSLSQERLGMSIDASRQQVHGWEKQETAPNGETVKKLALALGVTADYLLGLSDHPGMTEADGLSPEERRAIAHWRHGEKLKAIKAIVGE